jgi:hypothetical protein
MEYFSGKDVCYEEVIVGWSGIGFGTERRSAGILH